MPTTILPYLAQQFRAARAAGRLGKLVEMIINQVLEARMRNHLGGDRYERSEELEGYRNGYRERQIETRVGPLTLRVPQTRDGSFSADIFERYQRSMSALSAINPPFESSGGLYSPR